MAARLTVDKLCRTAAAGEVECLDFTSGVNVIVGPQNAGKSTWLRMFDYLMGETESAAEKFDDLLIRKYRAVSATLRLGAQTAVVERQWTEDGKRSQMTLNGDRFPIAELQTFMLEQLGIPILRYPQGNVLASDRTWPLLGWRSLLRHIYRRQDFWSDLVPLQPESEQHACLLQFLGLAEYVFSNDLAALVDKRRQITQLQSRKDYFVEMIHEIAPDLVDEQAVSVGITAQSIEVARARLQEEIENVVASRTKLLIDVRDGAVSTNGELSRLLDQRSRLLKRREGLTVALATIEGRLADLDRYRSGLRQELERLGRAASAAEIFEDVRITHCPACDQSVESRPRQRGSCFLCGQPVSTAHTSEEMAARRLDFERDQISAELAEAEELVQTADAERGRKQAELENTTSELRRCEASLRPFQAAAAAIVPEEVGVIDQRIGFLNARAEALQRLHTPLQKRDALSAEIDALQAEARRLDASLAEKEGKAEFEAASDRLGEGFNTYLNAIRNLDPTSWTKSGAVAVRISERRTQYLIAGRSAKAQLGGTLTIFFLLAYQYALLSLTSVPGFHYPGLTVLDFPAEIAKSMAIRERLNLVLEPFVGLAANRQIGPIQVIAAGRDFSSRAGVNLIPLSDTWR